MTKRCRHEYETKAGYPDDIICQKCQAIWTITDYLNWTPKQVMTLPLEVRRKLLERQVAKFNETNPDYYRGDAIMKCPNCQTEVFDVYTTEQRIKDLYNANLTLGWAQNRIRILAETIADRLKPNSTLPPVNLHWLATELYAIESKMKTVN